MSARVETAREMLLYTLWADRRMLAAVREVRPEDLTRDAGASFGSLLGTMAHMLGAQRVWLSRFAGAPLARVPGLADFPDLPAWIEGWEETAAGIEAFLATMTAEQLEAEVTWTTTTGQTYTRPLWQPVLHLANHTTYHRGQVVSLLRQMGYKPNATDLIYYFIEKTKES
jgi:uncharacterized damage-inducible protein DinB